MKRIMVLGAGVMQLPAFEAARRSGWQTIAVDGDPCAPGVEKADRFLHIDLKDTEAILEAARKEHLSRGLDGVFTVGTDFSVPVARVARELGLPGTSPDAAERASDKVLMRRTLSEAGIPVPRFLEVGPNDSTEELAEAVDRDGMLPVVVKPVDNMGARGVRRVDAREELATVVAEARAYSRTRRVIVEELISGEEYSIDALVRDGEIWITGVADRHVYFPPYFIELGHTLPADLPPERRVRLEEGFRRGVRALGISNGAAKGDVFSTENGVVIGEIAARLSGGYMSGWTYPNATGVSLVEIGMRLALGEEEVRLSPVRDYSSAERAAISIPGVVRAVHGLDVARRTRGVTDLFLRCAAGDSVNMPRNNTEKVANAISAAPFRAEAVAAAEQSVASVLVELEPAREETAAYLLSDAARGFPPFFPSMLRELSSQSVSLGGASPLARSARQDMERFRRDRVFPIPRGLGVLPEHHAGERDWNYRSVGGTIEYVRELRGLRQVEVPELSLPGTLIWRCLGVGGLQGALFAVDTMLEQPEWIEEYLSTWKV
jgi:biotin carboxylase